MPVSLKIRHNVSGLVQIKKDFDNLKYTRVEVGVLKNEIHPLQGGARTKPMSGPTQKTIAQVGAELEFGNPGRSQPARSFLRGPLATQLPEVLNQGYSQFRTSAKGVPTDVVSTVQEMDVQGARDAILKIPRFIANNAQYIVDRAFDTEGFGQWAKNAAYTKFLKGSKPIGTDTGALRRSIKHRIIGPLKNSEVLDF